ncbi:polysaccharide deacetylase family protein [Paraglaciecola aquimarina]|uniref:Polysaccharide deacetylase family protein n=1 Tax=Paraglaciecola aquimarina TaxID=1235557 RepID=A0ABU3STB0_9ALTE|nr:polysaccharide deacetylase family protein [Paraglaciecola aquimarina]MDU0353251.1 polysaccharide deacetylase family protein [Paraglaciecola aquimarina]
MLTLTWLTLSTNSLAQDNAVILVYHHVSTETPSSTSVSPEVFAEHMQYLADNYQVLPLKTVITKLQQKQPLPDKSVVITFDDGYKNIYQNAHPILKKHNFEYTIFVNPILIGKADYQLDWQQIDKMAKEGVSFANHGNAHIHSLGILANESHQDWLTRVTLNVQDAERLLQKKLGYSLKYFAYPYGEFNHSMQQKLTSLGYVGFGQHSGAIASHSDFSALPRYPAAGIYSKLASLKVKLSSLAMPVSNVTPNIAELDSSTDKIDLSFNIDSTDIHPNNLACFKNGNKLEHVNQGGQISMTLSKMRKPGRHRVNCTAPSKRYGNRYYWYSKPFFVPTADGEWLN